MLSLGLDTSTKTGYALILAKGGFCQLLESDIITSSKKGFDRLSDMATQLLVLLSKHKVDTITIEGYGFANKHSLVTLVEVGTVLKYFLYQEGYRWVEIPPNNLKQFVSGKGTSKKEMMLKEVYKLWDHDVNTNDEADAIGLAYIGLALKGVDLGLSKTRMSALKKLQLIA